MIRVEVSDNGCGMPQIYVSNILGHVQMERIGLSNVYERLCLFYHREGCMDIKTGPDGTTVILYLYKEV